MQIHDVIFHIILQCRRHGEAYETTEKIVLGRHQLTCVFANCVGSYRYLRDTPLQSLGAQDINLVKNSDNSYSGEFGLSGEDFGQSTQSIMPTIYPVDNSDNQSVVENSANQSTVRYEVDSSFQGKPRPRPLTEESIR